jgi:hypothetical protein
VWCRIAGTGTEEGRGGASASRTPQREPVACPPVVGRADRRAYYRVSGMLPVRVRALGPEEVDAAIFDLSLPDPLLQPLVEEGIDGPLAARLRRIEEKLDLLLGQIPGGDRPRPLSGQDRRSVVFSGSGLCFEVDFDFAPGDAFWVEILLPPPYLRTLRAVGFAVQPEEEGATSRHADRRSLALELRHMESEERDALVAYSYDVQRFALRHRAEEA